MKSVFAMMVLVCGLMTCGCEPQPGELEADVQPGPAATQPDSLAAAASQPEQPSAPAMPATMPDEPEAVADMPPAKPADVVPDEPPVEVSPTVPAPAPVPPVSPDGPGTVIQPGEPVSPRPAEASSASVLGVPVGIGRGVAIEFTMPGQGGPPMAPGADAAPDHRAAAQAALAVAIYNVTKEINPQSSREQTEDGYVSSDHFRYRVGAEPGLEVKSQTIVSGGMVKQFDIWLLVPAGDGQPAYQLHVRNFKLVGDVLDGARLKRLLASAGGHLIVAKVAGPDRRGMFTVDVALARRVK